MASERITSHLSQRIAGGRYRDTLLNHLREVEKQGEAVNASPHQKKAVALLHSLGEAINGQAVDSLVLGRLIVKQRHTTGGEDFRPGPNQRRFLSQLGPSEPTPAGAELLGELELCALQDLIAVMNDRVSLAQDRVANETRQAVRTKYEAEVTRAQESERKAKEKLHVLEIRNGQLAGENEFLRGRLDNGSEP